MSTQKVSDYIFEYIAQTTGPKPIFMLPGGGCMHLVDSVGKTGGMTPVCFLHEQGAAIAAESWAQDKNDMGVVLVTAGPGSTNAITGVAGAWIDSTPMLILSGQAKTTELMHERGVRQMGIQEVDIASIVKPITKYSLCVTNAQDVPYELGKAIWLATHGRRGPVWLDLPLDVQGAFISLENIRHYVPLQSDESANVRTAAQEILSALQSAKRPLIYAGNGIRAAGALDDFRKLTTLLRIPVALSWKAADFMTYDDPMYIGRPGIVGQRGANFAQQTCDVMLILGTRLDLCQTGFNAPHFAPAAKKYMVDIDESEIEKLDTPNLTKYVMDAGALIREMLALNPQPLPCENFLHKCKAWREKYPAVEAWHLNKTNGLVDLYAFVDILGRLMKPGDVLIPGSSGACAEVTLQAFPIYPGVRLHNTPGLGSMGFGLPALIGAALANPSQRVFGIVGDGGMMHNIQELETLHRLNLPVVLFVLNNNGYGSIRNMQKNRFNGHYVCCDPDSGLTIPNYEKLASGFQLPYARISSQHKLKEQLLPLLDANAPLLCEVMLDPAIGTAPHLSSRALPDGRMESLPMENLAPLLPEDEFNKNMTLE